jgi:hypothetical protein
VTRIEDRLRDAYEAAAQTVGPDSVPSLPDRTPAEYAGGIARRRRRLAIPLAAAAAIGLIAATTWLARQHTDRPTGSSPAAGGRAPAPPFIVGIRGSRDLGVYSARTGKLLTRVAPPGRGLSFRYTAATRDSRSFVVAVTSTTGGCSTLFYRLRLTHAGRPAGLTRLAVPRAQSQTPYGLAVSADGSTIAYSSGPCNGGSGRVSVARVGSPAVRTWPLRSEGVQDLSLTPRGRVLYFFATSVLGGDGTVRALRTDAPAGPAGSRSRVVLPATAGLGEGGGFSLARHGLVLLACSEAGHNATLTAYRPATGARLTVIHTFRHVTMAPCNVTATPEGSRALVSEIGPGLGTRVDLTTGRVQPFPASAVPDPPLSLSW